MANEKISTSAIKRSTVLALGIFAVFAFLLIRIFIIQTINFETYQNKVINQITTKSPVLADRGNIYDRNGNVLATNRTTYRVFISPSTIKDSSAEDGEDYATLISGGLSKILGVSYDMVYTQATEYTRYLDRTIMRKVEESLADKVRDFIDEHSLERMIYLEAQSTRYYPGSTLASHAVGFISGDGVGLYGLEYQYDKYLRGTDGYYVLARDSYGREMPFEYSSYIDAIDGYNVQSTIDTTIQSYLEEQLAKTVADHNVQNRACGIVIDVKTGAILAMATSSPFDLNDPWKLTDDAKAVLDRSGYAEGTEEYDKLVASVLTQTWSNKAVGESYIPGSTFKIITSAMSLDKKLVNMVESVNCPGYLTMFGIRIHCHQVKGHGSLAFPQGLQNSCNVWFMTLGERLGIDNFKQYVSTFGYNEKTGVDLPGEGTSIFNAQMSELDLAIYAFGQNFNVTPLQHLSAIASVANGGKLLQPYMVEQITDDAGNIIFKHETVVKRQTVSEDVCKTISKILEEGVSGDGGAKNAYVAGYRVAAKTGTSEKKERECLVCGYVAYPRTEGETVTFVCSVCGNSGAADAFPVSEKYICSTVAYAPADDPQVAIIIIVDEPTKGVLYGSTVAAPYVSDALEGILPELEITAEYTQEELDKMAVKVGSYRTWSVSYAQRTIESLGLKCVVVGNGDIVKAQKPDSGSYVEKKDGKVYLYTDTALLEDPSNSVTLPDFTGMTAIQANARLIGLGLNIKIEGTKNYLTGTGAVVFSQSVAPGTVVKKGEVITLNFRYMDADEQPDYTG